MGDKIQGGNQNDYPELRCKDKLATHIPVDPIDNDARNTQSPTRTNTGKFTAKRRPFNTFGTGYQKTRSKPKRSGAKQQ